MSHKVRNAETPHSMREASVFAMSEFALRHIYSIPVPQKIQAFDVTLSASFQDARGHVSSAGPPHPGRAETAL
jgi:hypothetical protein